MTAPRVAPSSGMSSHSLALAATQFSGLLYGRGGSSRSRPSSHGRRLYSGLGSV